MNHVCTSEEGVKPETVCHKENSPSFQLLKNAMISTDELSKHVITDNTERTLFDIEYKVFPKAKIKV